jgi:tetraacyldisaccharide 4'-kinase
MQLKFPKFWRNRTLLSYILLPLSLLYYLGFKLRILLTNPLKSPIPVICIGNINLGGSGKTPVALSVAKFFIQKGKKVVFVSKGYKGKLIGPVKVESNHTAVDVGDEPLLLNKIATCIIAKCRKAGVKAAADTGADIIIMDDGMQNPTIHKDLSIIVVDGEMGFGNGFLLPAGPLRETISNALARKPNIVVIVREDKRSIKAQLKDAEIIQTSMIPITSNLDLSSKYIAFAGIGSPEKFFTTLSEAKLQLADTLAFPDHYSYTETDIEQLLEKAKIMEAYLITTAKDIVRIAPKYHEQIIVLGIEIAWHDQTQLEKYLARFL